MAYILLKHYEMLERFVKEFRCMNGMCLVIVMSCISHFLEIFLFPFSKDLEDTLSKFLEDLPEDKYQLFMSLSDCKSEEKSEIGIWRTNNFALGPTSPKSSNGIFPTIARFNHSCFPSAEFDPTLNQSINPIFWVRKICSAKRTSAQISRSEPET